MDTFLVLMGLLCVIVGMLGSFLPVIPGVPVSWVGLLLLHLTDSIPMDLPYLGITLAVALLVFLLDYIIPAIGTKKYGGSKYGVIGTTLGLIVGLLAPIPFGFIIGPFLGAYIGEMMYKSDAKVASKAAFGSLVGLLASTFMKFVISVVFIGLFVSKVWEFRQALFAY